MQLGREKPQNLQMPLERPVQNYTPLARWNAQLILKHLDLEELDFQGPIVIIYPVRSGGSDVIFFSLMCETYLCWTHSPASFSLSAWTPSSSGSRATRRLQEVGRKGWRFRATQQRGERWVIKKSPHIFIRRTKGLTWSLKMRKNNCCSGCSEEWLTSFLYLGPGI